MNNEQIPLIIIQGPTAVGKSKFAIELALHLRSEIISADSRQVYKFLDIGTAKPDQKERKLIKHHLIDIVTPDINYNAGNFCEDANKVSRILSSQKKIPIIAGGTGFYIKALLEGLFEAPKIPLKVRKNLIEIGKKEGSKWLYQKLQKIDPESAQRANPNDLNRIIRALEVYEVTGKTITQLWKEKAPSKKNYTIYHILVTLERTKLYERIEKRVDDMMENGLLEELQLVLKKGYKKESPGLNTVGYKEFFPYLEGDAELADCVDKIKKNTRNFAKRQFTWFRKISFDLTIDANDINISKVLKKIKNKFGESLL